MAIRSTRSARTMLLLSCGFFFFFPSTADCQTKSASSSQEGTLFSRDSSFTDSKDEPTPQGSGPEVLYSGGEDGPGETNWPFVRHSYPFVTNYLRTELFSLGGICLPGAALHGCYTPELGLITLDNAQLVTHLDHSTVPLAGNFAPMQINFSAGVSVGLPFISNYTIVSNPYLLLHYGASTLPVELLYEEQNVQVEDQPDAPVTLSAYSGSPHSGRFLYKRFHGGNVDNPVLVDDELIDAASNIVYRMHQNFPYYFQNQYPSSWIYPIEAQLLDGYKVVYHYTGGFDPYDPADNSFEPSYLAGLTLSRNGVPIETVTINYTAAAPARIRDVMSSRDQSMNVHFIYAEEAPVFSTHYGVAYVLFGGGNPVFPSTFQPSDWRAGIQYDYKFAGEGVEERARISAINTLAGERLRTYTFDTIPYSNVYRTVYNGFLDGPYPLDNDGIPLRTAYHFDYFNATPGAITVTSPEAPGSPIAYDFNGRGRPEKVISATCPDPIEEIIYHNVNPLDPLWLRVQQVILRPNCTDIITKSYFYYPNGDIERIETQAGSGPISTEYFQTTSVTTTNNIQRTEISQVIDPVGLQTDFTWDSCTGRLEGIHRSDGVIQTSFEYSTVSDADDVILDVTTTHENGRKDRVFLNDLGHVSAHHINTDSNGELTIAYGYNESGRLHTVTDPKGNITTVAYNDDEDLSLTDGRIKQVSISSADSSETRSTTYHYHPDFPDVVEREDRVVALSEGAQSYSVHHEYQDDTPLLLTTTISNDTEGNESLGHLATYEYESDTLQMKRACGYNRTGSTTADCVDVHRYDTGDLAGFPQYLSYGKGAAYGGFDRHILYDEHGAVTGERLVDNTGREIVKMVELDERGRIDSCTLHPDAGVNEVVTNFEYDAVGKLLRADTSVGGVLVSDVGWRYAHAGKSPLVTLESDSVTGTQIALAYNDPAKRLTSVTTLTRDNYELSTVSIPSGSYNHFDQPGEVAVSIDGVGHGRTASTYNEYGEVESITDKYQNTTTFDHDHFGRQTLAESGLAKVTNQLLVEEGELAVATLVENKPGPEYPDHNYTSSSKTKFDKLGRLASIDNESTGLLTTYNYNNRGLLEQILTRNGNGGSKSERYGYDNLSRRTLTRHGVPGEEEIVAGRSYTGLGYLNSVTDARGNTTSFEYDILGRIAEVNYPDGSYDIVQSIQTLPVGSAADVPQTRVATTLRSGSQSVSEYNSLGQVLKVSVTDPTYGNYEKNYFYNSVTHNLNKETVVSAGVTTHLEYGYDDYGRATRETTKVNDPEGSYMFEVGKSYDARGLITKITYPNGESANYTRDSFGRITLVSLDDVSLKRYRYAGALRKTETLHPIGNMGASPITRNYSYESPHGLLAGYSDQKIAEELILTDVAFTYDDWGRVQTQIDSGLRGTEETFGYTIHDVIDTYALTLPDEEGDPVTLPTRNYGARMDGTLAIAGQVDSMYQLYDIFRYDFRGFPVEEIRGPTSRSLEWSHDGLIHMSDTANRYSFDFTQDAVKRYIRRRRTDLVNNSTYTSTFAYHNGLPLWEHVQEECGPAVCG